MGAEKGWHEMPFAYPQNFKQEMLGKLLPPNAQSAYEVSAETRL
jgi:hypothetical protein